MAQATLNTPFSLPLFILAIIFLLFLYSGGLVYIFLKFQNKKNQMLRHEEEMRMQFEQTLLQTQLEIQEQTLQKVSFEIHDNIGQVLSLVKLQLATIDFGQEAPLKQKIEHTHSLVAKVMQDLRGLSHGLNSDYVTTQGLMNAVRLELESVHRVGMHEVAFDRQGVPFQLEKEKELILFRIVQEALHNAIRHGGANLLKVNFIYTPEQLELIISDNGKGFDLEKINNSKGAGLGIKSMRSRAALIGATYNINSSPGTGTTVTVSIPNKSVTTVTR